MNARERDLRRMVVAKGYELIGVEQTKGNHYKVSMRDPHTGQSHVIYAGLTPGDWRADKNMFSGRSIGKDHRPVIAIPTGRPIDRRTREQIRADRIERRLRRVKERERIVKGRAERALARALAHDAWKREHEDVIRGVEHYGRALNGHAPVLLVQAAAELAKDHELPHSIVVALRERFEAYKTEEYRRTFLRHIGAVGERVKGLKLKVLAIEKLSRKRYVYEGNEHMVRLETKEGDQLRYQGQSIGQYGKVGKWAKYDVSIQEHVTQDGQPMTVIGRVLRHTSGVRKKRVRTARPNACKAGAYSHLYVPHIKRLNVPEGVGRSVYIPIPAHMKGAKLGSMCWGMALYLWGKGSITTKTQKGRLVVTRLK